LWVRFRREDGQFVPGAEPKQELSNDAPRYPFDPAEYPVLAEAHDMWQAGLLDKRSWLSRIRSRERD
jgi:hypothetical protein